MPLTISVDLIRNLLDDNNFINYNTNVYTIQIHVWKYCNDDEFMLSGQSLYCYSNNFEFMTYSKIGIMYSIRNKKIYHRKVLKDT